MIWRTVAVVGAVLLCAAWAVPASAAPCVPWGCTSDRECKAGCPKRGSGGSTANPQFCAFGCTPDRECKAGCPTKGSESGPFSRCFGAAGGECEGVPPNAPSTRLADGRVRMYVAVGSILHDNCCAANPKGRGCGGVQTFVNTGCIDEWHKAASNVAMKYTWSHVFSGKQEKMEPAPARRSSLGPRSYGETKFTRTLSAPAGTRLDAGDEAFCASGRATKKKLRGGAAFIVCN